MSRYFENHGCTLEGRGCIRRCTARSIWDYDPRVRWGFSFKSRAYRMWNSAEEVVGYSPAKRKRESAR